MNRLMRMWPLMAEAGGEGGGGNPPPANEPPKNDPPPANDPPKNDPPPANDPPKEDPPKNDPPKNDPPPANKPVNLMDDDPGETHEEPKPPTEDEIKAFREGIKATDLGEGVTFDDAALDAMQQPLMELAGNDPQKAEKLVKAYTDYRRAEIARQQEKDDAFVGELVAASQKRFGNDLKQMVSLAKSGGRRVFGDALWNQMKSIPQFANNPDIIERLAAFGKSVKDDPGAVKKETGTTGRSSDWRENMYGGAKK